MQQLVMGIQHYKMEQLVPYLIGFMLLTLIFKRIVGRRVKMPPSPWGLPLIGHFNLLSRAVHLSFHAISKKYGPIFLLRLGVVPVVVVSNGELAREVLKTQDHIFASRPYMIHAQYITYNFKGIGTAPYSDHWKNVRKLCTTELFTVRRLESFMWVRKEELSHMCLNLVHAAWKNQAVNMRQLVTTYTFNVLTRVLMTKRYFEYGKSDSDIDGEAKEFKQVCWDVTDISLNFHISEFLPPSLRWLDWSIAEMKRILAVEDRFLNRILDEHKSVNNSREYKDFVDLMLEYLEQAPDREDVIKGVVMDLVSAGTDTTACVIEWALAELLQNPECLQKAREELDRVVGRERMVEEGDFDKLEYIQAIVKEAFRLHPPGPLLPHAAMEATTVGGYYIPKGASTFVNVHAIGRDPAVWENPDKFNPERFLGSPMDVLGQHFDLLPFGAGRRGCVGKLLGMKNVYLVASNLIHGFDWRFVPGKTYNLDPHLGTLNWTKTPLEVIPAPRLPDYHMLTTGSSCTICSKKWDI